MWAVHPQEQTAVLHQSLPKEERKTKTKDEAEGQGVPSGGAAPTEGSGDDVWRLDGPQCKFHDQENILWSDGSGNLLQVALLNKDSLLESWLFADQEKKKGISFSICQSIKHWLSPHPVISVLPHLRPQIL